MAEITQADLYRALGSLEGKFDQLLQDLAQSQTDQKAAAEDTEKRIRSLEGSRSRAYGAAGVISAIVAIVSNYFFSH